MAPAPSKASAIFTLMLYSRVDKAPSAHCPSDGAANYAPIHGKARSGVEIRRGPSSSNVRPCRCEASQNPNSHYEQGIRQSC